MEFCWIIGFVLLIIILIIIIGYLISIYNALVRLKNNIDKAWSNIDVLLKQRHDELPKLLKTVKAYMKYEKEVLTKVTEARTAFMNARTVGEKAMADDLLTGALKSLFAVAENYPKLQASESYKHLQTRISGLENELADRREFYNDSVTEFNTRIHSIPDMFVASMLHYTDKPVFEATAAEKKDIKIKLS